MWCTACSCGVLPAHMAHCLLNRRTACSCDVLPARPTYCLLTWRTVCLNGVLPTLVVYCLLVWRTACSCGVLPIRAAYRLLKWRTARSRVFWQWQLWRDVHQWLCNEPTLVGLYHAVAGDDRVDVVHLRKAPQEAGTRKQSESV